MSKSATSGFTLVRVIVLAGILLLAASLIGWWRMVYSSPTNVFDRMLANSLATPSVSKEVAQADESQQLRQTSTLLTAPQQAVRAISVHDQTAGAKTSVVTESIGTPDADFVRYLGFSTTEKNSQGQDFDFSSIVGVWGKSTQDDPSSGGVQLFNQAVLGVVPTANVRPAQRKALLEQIKKDEVYKIDPSTVKRQTKNGRPLYSYDVQIEPVAYVTMLKSFAQAIGLTALDQVDPSQYAQSQPLKFVFDIDVWSGQLTKLSYDNSDRAETYSGYGARLSIDEPDTSVSVSELQNRLQQLQ